MDTSEEGGRPAGLDALNKACRAVYPDQPNPLQVTALVKYWLGGPDPLDYISMYSHHGDGKKHIFPHWHYVSFGLSDLHGDGRVHTQAGPGQPSGFGFELTFRLRRDKDEASPPTWPAELLQALARYVFQSDNVLCPGDHISWHSPLDKGDSLVQHMLLAQDPGIPAVNSPLGTVSFVQVVGVMDVELEAAQQWKGPGLLQLLRQNPATGGPWLVTDMRRGESLFHVDLNAQVAIKEGMQHDGSNLSGVSAVCSWEDGQGRPGSGLAMPQVHGADSAMEGGYPEAELLRTTTLDYVHLQFNLEAGRLLPLALRGRVMHGRHFTYKSLKGEVAITFVCSGVQGSFADERHPFAAHGPWLQVWVDHKLAEALLSSLEQALTERQSLPHKMELPDKHLAVTIFPNN